MFYLLLESLLINGKLKNIDIVVYTCSEFSNIIKQHYLYNTNIIFEINDTYNTINLACKARLDCFQLECIQNYEKILYYK